MVIGAPKEIKPGEQRVALTPAGARALTEAGHHVLVEIGAGAGSGLPDGDYSSVGARLTTAEEVWQRADLVLKVKEPMPNEIKALRAGQTLFTYLHLAADRELTDGLRKSDAILIAYETVQRPDGSLPLRMDGHSHRFLLRQGAADDVAFLGWQVADAAALQALRRHLADRIPVTDGTPAELAARGVAELFHIKDPQGLRVEFFHGPAKGSPGWRSEKMGSGFHTDGLGMGHVLMNVKNQAETERFWRETLGFRVSDWLGGTKSMVIGGSLSTRRKPPKGGVPSTMLTWPVWKASRSSRLQVS